MAKQRNADTEIWKDPWHRKLSPNHKLFWKYICDNCDDAGVWKEDMELAQFQIGAEIQKEPAMVAFNSTKERILEFKPGYWLVLGFVGFHYGELVPTNNFHKHVLKLQHQHGLGSSEALPRPCRGIKGTDKDKDTCKDKGTGKDQEIRVEVQEEGGAQSPPVKQRRKVFRKPDPEEVKALMAENGLSPAEAESETRRFFNHYESCGWVVGRAKPMVSWRGAVGTWLDNRDKFNETKNDNLTPQQRRSLATLERIPDGF